MDKDVSKNKMLAEQVKEWSTYQIYIALCAYILVLAAKMNDVKKYRIMKDAVYDFIIKHKSSIMMFERG